MSAADPESSVYGLAFETSGAIGGVALGRDGELMEGRRLSRPLRHAVEFVATLADLCHVHGVPPDRVGTIYVSVGPGSFTGLRIGIAAARMLSMASGARLVAVPTLDVIAQNALDLPDPPDRVAVVLDAKRRNTFAAVFARQANLYVPVSAPAEVEPTAFLTELISGGYRCGVLGEGVAIHRAAIEGTGVAILPDELHAARCEMVYRLGHQLERQSRFTPRRELIPHYLRPPEAEEKWRRRQAQLPVS